MTDLAILAFGFASMPLAALLLYSFRGSIRAHPEASWGLSAGVVAFLALSHAMADVLFGKALLAYPEVAGDTVAILVPFAGLALGAVLGRTLFEGHFLRTEPARILWAAVAFFGLHSFVDGLVLGADFVGSVSPTVRLDAIAVIGTFLHRFAEGSLVVIPLVAFPTIPRRGFLLLFVSFLALPGAYVPSLLFDLYGFTQLGSATREAIPVFAAAIEASLGLFLMVRGFLPGASASPGSRRLSWVAVGFVAISVVHFLVE